MNSERLIHDLADGHAGVKTGERVLKDDLQLTAQRLQLTACESVDRSPHPNDLPFLRPQQQ